MSKKKKRRRRRVRVARMRSRRALLALAKDKHHICFQKRHWCKGYAKLIREAFVKYIPVIYHRELHSGLIDVPVPNEKLLRAAWFKYQENQVEIDSYDVARAAAWLYVNIPDEEFRRAMQYQIDFFATRGGQP